METEDDADDDADEELPAASVMTATETTKPICFGDARVSESSLVPPTWSWIHGWLAISKVARASDRAMSSPPKETLLAPERVKNFQCLMGFSTRK